MSKTGFFNKVPVHIQDHSGFDMSFEHVATLPGMGTVVPLLCKEVMPGDVWSVGQMSQVKLLPMACDWYGRLDLRIESFFVPSRLLWAGFQHFIINDPNYQPNIPGWTAPSSVPTISLGSGTSVPNNYGTLADYLGVKYDTEFGTSDLNILPFLAYHKIIDDWYINPATTKPFFADGIPSGQSVSTIQYIPFLKDSVNFSWNSTGFNGKRVGELRQRCYAKDYFTTATVNPQGSATPVSVKSSLLAGDTPVFFDMGYAYDDNGSEVSGDGQTSFTIQQLRVANSLQKWLERNNLSGMARYYDSILAHFGVLPSDANIQRAILLGTDEYSVVTNSVSQQAASDSSTSSGTVYNVIGGEAGKSSGFGKGRLIDNFKATEFGYIFVMASLVPHAYYSTGTDRMFRKTASLDYPFPEFSNIGDQELFASELTLNASSNNHVFGYQQRYSDLKCSRDMISGYLRDDSGDLVNHMVLQRSIQSATPSITTEFVEIPKNALDNQFNAKLDVSKYVGFIDIYFDAKALRVLPEYSMPSI